MLYLTGELKYRMNEDCVIDEDKLRLMLVTILVAIGSYLVTL